MRKFRKLIFFLEIIIAGIILFLATASHTVNASIQADDIDDGITNWQNAGGTNEIGMLSIAKGLGLGYTFGDAPNTGLDNGVPGNDASILTDSNSEKGHFNVFLVIDGNYYGALYGNIGGPGGSGPFNSPDFMIAPPTNKTGLNFDTNGVIKFMKNKVYFKGIDQNGNYAYKIMGDYNNNTGINNNEKEIGNYQMEAELLLRPSPTNAAIVHRELYLKNNTNSTQTFRTMYSEDTKLGDNDAVPILDIGKKSGIFIQSDDEKHRLFINNHVKGGFTQYTGNDWDEDQLNWTNKFNPANISGDGAEIKGHHFGDTVLNSGDTAYALKWPTTVLKKGETAHFGSAMGVTQAGYSIPTPSKTYQNLTNNDGTNRPGDKLEFTLSIINNGYDSKWNFKKLVDALPKGLQVDPTSMKQAFNGGATTDIDPSNYDAATRTISIPMAQQLGENEFMTVTYKASLTNDALTSMNKKKLITNVANFTGSDIGSSDRKYEASVDIPITPPDFKSELIKSVKNESNGDKDYLTETKARQNDTVDYKLIYSVDSQSDKYLLKGANLVDTLPQGLSLVPKSIEVSDTNGMIDHSTADQVNITLPDIKQGEQVEVKFKAIVNSTKPGGIVNSAIVNNITKSDGKSHEDVVSNLTTLNVSDVDAFISVPSLIDFGNVNLGGINRTLFNISTKGELIVSHPTTKDFSVAVSLDDMKDKENNSLIPIDSSGLLFLKQRQKSADEDGSWQPVSSEGTALQTGWFSGNQVNLNLTDYIGVNNWKLRMRSDNKSGLYKGILTWSMTDSISA